MNPIRILCVHGVGNHQRNLQWQDAWKTAIEHSIQSWRPPQPVEFAFTLYDDLFQAAPLNPLTVAQALFKLGSSGVVHGIGDLFRRRRGVFEAPELIRWTAGMVVQWAENNKLRQACRERLLESIRAFKPSVVCAHSLGSLISYDTFLQAAEPAFSEIDFIAFGSQIGNPFVRGTFAGRIVPLPNRRWFHLYNRHDNVFTSRIRLQAPNFEEIDSPFDIAGLVDHDAPHYLSHPNTIHRVWRQIAGGPAHRSFDASGRAFAVVSRKPKRRALLVGINDYPRPEDRLEGCLNDVFLMSSLLQEHGFDPEDIRVVLDDRATAQGIRDRLEWLLDDAEDGHQRFFYYSGHGTQIPRYGLDGKIADLNECLVPHDFAWTPESALLDDQFYDLYSQLPYPSHFMAVFDCCHSGGMARDGGRRIRGLTPPDDIRHRALKWDAQHEMWVPRDLVPLNRSLARGPDGSHYLGESGAKRRLGRASAVRTLPNVEYDKVRAQLQHHGPYLPMIFQACGENEYSYEYRHGVTSYGAFTYALSVILRRYHKQRKPISFEQLLQQTSKTLKALRYDQTPCLIGPRPLLRQRIPWQLLRS